MQGKKAPVFLVATANDVSQLPPGMLRKGRFDERFFVDLPNQQEREAIWETQINKYSRDRHHFDIVQLPKVTERLTGSEIENALSSPMQVTGRPSIVLGMVTDPPRAGVSRDGNRAVIGRVIKRPSSRSGALGWS